MSKGTYTIYATIVDNKCETNVRGSNKKPRTVETGTVHRIRLLTKGLIRLTRPNLYEIYGQTKIWADTLVEKSSINT